MKPVARPPKQFTMTAIIDNGADWVSTGMKPGDGHETGPHYTDEDVAGPLPVPTQDDDR